MLVCSSHPSASVEMNMTSMEKLTTVTWTVKEIRTKNAAEYGQTRSTKPVRKLLFWYFGDSIELSIMYSVLVLCFREYFVCVTVLSK